MVRLFKNFEAELEEVAAEEALLARAEQTAAALTPMQRMRLENQYQTNPQLPADAQLALAVDPNGAALFDQVSMQYARTQSPLRTGQRVTLGMVRADPNEDPPGMLQSVMAQGLQRAGQVGGVVGDAAGVATGVARKLDPGLVGGAEAVGGLVGEPAYDALKGYTRTLMPALDFGQQMIQAKGRDVAAGVSAAADGEWAEMDRRFRASTSLSSRDALAQVEQTDLGQQGIDAFTGVGQALTGQEVTAGQDLGSGFFANEESERVQRRVQAERRMGTLPNGQTYTIGRSTAAAVGLDPEGTSYSVVSGLLDAAVAVGAPGPENAMARGLKKTKDTAAVALGGVPESTFLTDAGAYRGMFSQVDLPRAVDWVHSEKSDNLVDFLTRNNGDRGWNEIWEATGGNLDPFTVTRLEAAQSADEVRSLLEVAIRSGGRPTLDTGVSRGRAAIGRAAQGGGTVRRLGGQVPESTINLRDPASSVNTISDFARNVKADRAVSDRWTALMGRASNEIERRQAYTQILGETTEMLSRGGIPEGRALQLTKYMQGELETSRTMFDDVLRMDVGEWSKRAAFGEVDLPPITVLAEAATDLPLPNARDLRRATSWARPLWETSENAGDVQRFVNVLGSGWQKTFDGLMMVQSKWKDMRLLRLGYPLRVLPEEQLRRIAAGDTMINHPAGLLGYILDNPNLVDSMDENISGIRNALDGTDLVDDDIFRAAMADQRLAGLRDGVSGMRRGALTRVKRDGDNQVEFLTGWRDELLTLGADPVATRLSRSSVDETWAFLRGAGGDIRDKLISLEPELADDIKLRQYLETITNRIQAVTGGNDELMNAVQRGVLPDSTDLGRLVDSAPEYVVARGFMKGDEVGAYDRIVGSFFDAIAASPTNRLSRSPVFVRAYEQNLVELAPLAARPDDIIQAARRANVSQSAMDAIVAGAKGEGLLQLDHLDTLAKKGALDTVQGLLYDVTRSSQLFDQFRLLAPFGEAWKEVVTTWVRLFADDPFTVTRRAGQTGRALTSNDTGQAYFDLAGLDKESDSGFFYENEYGDQVFYYPYSQELTEWATSRELGAGTMNVPGVPVPVPVPFRDSGDEGVPFRMEGGARSLNLAGEILPGLGPFAQVAASEVLPNNTTWDPIREQLFPFGAPKALSDMAQYLPAWAATMLKGQEQLTPDQLRLYGNTQWRVARYLYSTGDYEPGPEGDRQLLEDTEAATRRLFFIRGTVQFAAPASPLLASTIIGPDGELEDQAVMIDRYQVLLEEDYETAFGRFLEEFGPGSLLATQGNTVSTTYGGTPLDGAAYDWVRDNPEVADEHPELFGFFAPVGEGSEFSSEAYRRSLENGERIQLSQDDKLALSQHRMASWEYRQYRDLIEGTPNDEQQAILDAVRANLLDKYPGYNRIGGIGSKDPVYSVIDSGDVDRALENPLLVGTPAGAALVEYWGFREQVVSAAEAQGLRSIGAGGWRSANDGEPFRDLLRAAGEDLVSQEPEFARMWDLFLSQEFEESDDE